ncbi:MAG TPA: UbiA family prenyltransferase, partial [Acidimicrobiales bacterium]|nr:UbiA family prenyltransferase [Acidimicrobiales bacterium]
MATLAPGERPLSDDDARPGARGLARWAGHGHGHGGVNGRLGVDRPAPDDPTEGPTDPAAALDWRGKVGAYVALTKPRIIELLLVTTVPTMVVAARGLPPLGLIFETVIGGALAAGGANAINMYVDRDIDRLMKRTSKRPLVTGVIRPRNALVFAVSLEI